MVVIEGTECVGRDIVFRENLSHGGENADRVEFGERAERDPLRRKRMAELMAYGHAALDDNRGALRLLEDGNGGEALVIKGRLDGAKDPDARIELRL